MPAYISLIKITASLLLWSGSASSFAAEAVLNDGTAVPAADVIASNNRTKKQKKKAKKNRKTEQQVIMEALPEYELLPVSLDDEFSSVDISDETELWYTDIETADAEATALAGLNVYDDARPLHITHEPEVLDSLVSRWNEAIVYSNYENYFRDFIDLDSTASLAGELPDSVYSARLKMMVSPIYLGYNDIVKRYIVAYTQSRKGTMARILGMSQSYFPMIEEQLAVEGLPLELRMLPVIESALNPRAVSRMGASGLWQFMYGTGKSYGLEITSYIDERFDPIASTRAACRFLKDLYNMYNDWTLALAAYNCGPGNVNKAIKRAGGNARTFWDIYDYLPRETRGYVPAFIGATYAFAYHRQHGIEPVPHDFPVSRDTVRVDKLLHLEQVSSTMGMDIETVRALNPQYKLDIIPAVENKTYHITLPQYEIGRYLESETEIHAKDSIYLAQYLRKDPVTNAQAFNITTTEYRIKSGDTLGAIARKYGVTVNQLMKWNNIKNPNALRIGQRIQINK